MSPETVHEIAKMRRRAGRILDVLEAIRDGVSVQKSAVSDAISDLYDFRLTLGSLGTDIVSGGSPTCGDFARALVGFEVDLAVTESKTNGGELGLDAAELEGFLYLLREDLSEFLQIYEKYLRRGAPLDQLGELTEEEREEIRNEAKKNTPWK